jgi:hypothetical protein
MDYVKKYLKYKIKYIEKYYEAKLAKLEQEKSIITPKSYDQNKELENFFYINKK